MLVIFCATKFIYMENLEHIFQYARGWFRIIHHIFPYNPQFIF